MSRGRELLLGAVATAAALALAEAACRLLLPPPGFQSFGPHSAGLVVPHPARGYAYATDLVRNVIAGGRVIQVRLNALGLRDRAVDPADSVEQRVLALGDSYTVGFGVEEDEAWPRLLEARLDAGSCRARPVRVINAGVSGYGLRQMRLWGEELVPRLRPAAVVLGFYVQGWRRVTDPYTYFNGGIVRASELPRIAPAAGGVLVARLGRPTLRGLEFWLDRHFWFGAHLLALAAAPRDRRPDPHLLTVREAAPRLAPALAELRSLARELGEAGIPLVVLLIYHQEPDGSFAATADTLAAVITEATRDARVPTVNLLPILRQAARGAARFRLGTDPHWTPEAHRLAAAAVAPALAAVLEPTRCSSPHRAPRPAHAGPRASPG
ncbi:MAG TPA: hypothetical protein VNJ71_01125 [Gemmatimonadales bacterium]|nr:hypothetical protein [Gemmatimonadales bacterium]